MQKLLGLDGAIEQAAARATERMAGTVLDRVEESLRRHRLDLLASVDTARAAAEKAANQAADRVVGQVGEVLTAMHAALDARVGDYITAVDQHLTLHVNAQSDATAARLESVQARLEAVLVDNFAGMRSAMAELGAAGQVTLLQEIHHQLGHVDAHLSEHLTKELSLQLGGSRGTTRVGGDLALLQRRLVTLGRLLETTSARGMAKIRVGHSGDGGYVMLDDFADVGFALSLGVGAEMTWDVAMADRGIDVHQFDYTIDAPPGTHNRIHFHRSRITPMQDGTDHSLQSAQALGGNGPCIVKMDIEGDEWSVLEAAGENDFSRVTQLVVEMHDLARVDNEEWFARAERVLRRLADTFRVVHVHANNNGPLMTRGNVAFPDILEVTFANRSRYEFEPFTETLPTALDAPNRDDLPDIVLGAFRF